MRYQAPKTGAYFPCQACGKQMWVIKALQGAKRFCSRKCDLIVRPKERVAKRAQRFWDRVIKTDGCWEWRLKPATKFGYCIFAGQLAHRFSWSLVNGPIPEGMQVNHHCDNPKCVRPDHLFIGTQLDNVRDMMAKGRHRMNLGPKGDRHHFAKLSEETVKLIRESYTGKRGDCRKIADRYGCSLAHVYAIVHNKIRLHG